MESADRSVRWQEHDCCQGGLDTWSTETEETVKNGNDLNLEYDVEQANQPDTFNLAVALERVGGDEDLLREIAQVLIDECPEALLKVQKAVQASDAKALDRSAHSLKGSVANFGAKEAYDAALRLEEMGRNEQLDEAPQALADLETALERLRPELAEFASG